MGKGRKSWAFLTAVSIKRPSARHSIKGSSLPTCCLILSSSPDPARARLWKPDSGLAYHYLLALVQFYVSILVPRCAANEAIKNAPITRFLTSFFLASKLKLQNILGYVSRIDFFATIRIASIFLIKQNQNWFQYENQNCLSILFEYKIWLGMHKHFLYNLNIYHYFDLLFLIQEDPHCLNIIAHVYAIVILQW